MWDGGPSAGSVYLKIDQHGSSSCRSTFGLLYFMGSNTMIFAVLKDHVRLHIIVSYGIKALIAVMNFNIPLSQSLPQIVFISNILDLLQLCH